MLRGPYVSDSLSAHSYEKNGSSLQEDQAHSFLNKFSDAGVLAMHRLMMLMTSLQEKIGANEMYVRRVLAEQVGISPVDLSVWTTDPSRRSVFRLSVRREIEPVVNYLKSQGVTGG